MATTAEMDALIVAVKANDDVEDSATVLLNGLVPVLQAVAGDKAATLALATDIQARTAALSAAVAANTPAAP